ncbi:DNA methyltransferase [Ligilactobacillus aviarius]|uniref:DNA-methyltransferase n=1 Tax=Ligilactobacillus aviarius TaxID=1606 RepID=UPI0007D9E3FB|nr:site-specific DNA-methyltransferase [Ligilactobacillus aviarius]OAQ02343.1 DNA methyltransferase [Ligilactobacillus aviarius]OAQ05094.1 DNA methyltransferase [Ligilactobacillus aviarius]OAS79126.1 DNA methyltransferase [Ligilactobacillus aviarius]PEG71501.1 site-specific DNA-methyltransferase [Ligilactobacillus aviarius]PEG73877.1 site-specific DNA-methyltransferase [Ligilactobacillus aviarius]
MKIYNTDAYKIISKFKNENLKVDHIITDPPYNISKENNFSTMNSAKRKGVDFGKWDKEFDLYSWISDYSELIRPGGSIIIFCSYRYISYIVDNLENVGLVVKDVLKWIKSNPMPRNINRRYVQDTEFAVWAVKKGGKWVFNKPENVSYLRAEFHTSTVLGKERTSHPTQKSLALMEDIINIHTNPHDLILDPFMGSGTTGVAALRNNRRFIGVEINEEYFNIAKKRLTEENNILLF